MFRHFFVIIREFYIFASLGYIFIFQIEAIKIP